MISGYIFHAITYQRLEIPANIDKIEIQRLIDVDTKNLNDLIKESEYRAQILLEVKRDLT